MESTLINGIKIWVFESRKQLVDFAFDEKKILVAINADKILHATDQTKNLINSNLGYSDGVGAVLVLKKKGYKNAIKIPGCELWLEIIKQSENEKSFYFVGATEDVIQETIQKLKKEFPNIKILGFRNGFVKTDQEKEILINDIELKKPDVVFVAMGSPKQELLMQEMQSKHKCIYQGLGGSFDVYIGKVKRAPQWWINNNLEGLYRLIMQPQKIKRYINALPFWWNLVIGKYNK